MNRLRISVTRGSEPVPVRTDQERTATGCGRRLEGVGSNPLAAGGLVDRHNKRRLLLMNVWGKAQCSGLRGSGPGG